jgi:hypothetical protein
MNWGVLLGGLAAGITAIKVRNFIMRGGLRPSSAYSPPARRGLSKSGGTMPFMLQFIVRGYNG